MTPTKCRSCPIAHFPTCGGQADPRECHNRATPRLLVLSALASGLPSSWVASNDLIAPAGCLDLAPGTAHRGRVARKPWDFPITATLAHLNTPGPLALVVELLRLQSERPYILIIDTGSPPDVLAEVEALRDDDLEIHHLRAHAWDHSSAPVAAACDLALDLCRSERIFFTHADCFPVSRDLLARLSTRCAARNPLVGSPLSPRDNMDDWRWMVGHTCLMVHVPTARRIGARWGREAAVAAGHLPATAPFDTEYGFNWAFRAAGIGADLLGDEANFARNRNDDFDHPRSFATSAIYGWIGGPEYRARVHRWMADAMADARLRIDRWRGATQEG